jgi:hypothetical protein
MKTVMAHLDSATYNAWTCQQQLTNTYPWNPRSAICINGGAGRGEVGLISPSHTTPLFCCSPGTVSGCAQTVNNCVRAINSCNLTIINQVFFYVISVVKYFYFSKVSFRGLIAAAILLTTSGVAAPLVQASTNAPARWHSIVVKPDTNIVARIHFYDKLNPIWWCRNLGEPIAPAWYRPGEKHRNLKYHLRNPGDNFCSYVIGIEDKQFIRSGHYPEYTSNPHGGLNFAICRRCLLVLPFVDWRLNKFEFYLGWRTNGSFGLACRSQPPPQNPTSKLKPAANGVLFYKNSGQYISLD